MTDAPMRKFWQNDMCLNSLLVTPPLKGGFNPGIDLVRNHKFLFFLNHKFLYLTFCFIDSHSL